MSRRRGLGLLQDLTIAALALSALFLLLKVVSYESGGDGRVAWPGLLASGPKENAAGASDLTALAAPVDIVVTNQYGRGSCLAAGGDQTQAEPLVRLLREAMGSAGTVERTAETDFRAALDGAGVYFDYLVPLPANLAASRLGVELRLEGNVRRLLLSPQGEGVRLYLWDGTGDILRCPTAVSPEALREAVDLFGTDGTFFAFEAGEGYAALDPYSILQEGRLSLSELTAAPASVAGDMDTLLSLLDFSVHTRLSYTQADGTQVVEESPRTLRLRPDGTILYTGDVQTASPLFDAGGQETDAIRSVLAVHRLLETLLGGEGDTGWYLSSCQETAEGVRLTFDYLAGGVPVYFSDDRPAMEAEVAQGVIVSFTLRCRQYTLTQDRVSLLPARQAAAIAEGRYPGAFLTPGYADRYDAGLSPLWLARPGTRQSKEVYLTGE